MRNWVLPIVLMALCAGAYLFWRHHQMTAPFHGGSGLAPEFSLTDLTGQKVDLADYRGQVVLLDFWATWCEPCRREIPHFIALQNTYRDRGLRIVGISLDDSIEPVRAFYKDFKMNYPVAMGDAQLAERYGGIFGLPVSFVVGCDGKIHARHIGEVSSSVIEQEIQPLLKAPDCRSK